MHANRIYGKGGIEDETDGRGRGVAGDIGRGTGGEGSGEESGRGERGGGKRGEERVREEWEFEPSREHRILTAQLR